MWFRVFVFWFFCLHISLICVPWSAFFCWHGQFDTEFSDHDWFPSTNICTGVIWSVVVACVLVMLSNFVPVRSEGVCFRLLFLYPIFFLRTALETFLFFLFFYFLGGRALWFGTRQMAPFSRIGLFSFMHQRVCWDTCLSHLFSYEMVPPCLCLHSRFSYGFMHSNLETRARIHACHFLVAFPRLVYPPVFLSFRNFFLDPKFGSVYVHVFEC